MPPVNVAKSVAGRARSRGRDLVEAVKEGRLAMRAKEAELRAGREPTALPVAPAAQIIVLSDVRQLEQLARAVSREAAPPREPASRPTTRRDAAAAPVASTPPTSSRRRGTGPGAARGSR